MGDHLQVGKTPGYVTCHLARPTQPTILSEIRNECYRDPAKQFNQVDTKTNNITLIQPKLNILIRLQM